MKTLLHICCAPCSIMCIDTLRGEGIEPVGYWYNPNIHPFTEYRSRKNALMDYAQNINLKLITEDDYGLREFVKNVSPNFDARCGYCYNTRLGKVAEFAAQNGFDSFTSTLLISPYQNHDQMCSIMEESAAKHGVKFLYRDFRPYFKEGQQRARELELYMQKYCGCIFSEEERYKKKKKV